MFELCYSSGLRLAELADMKPEDLSLSDGTARVTGKGGKTRIVPVGSKAIQACARMDKTARGLGQAGRIRFVPVPIRKKHQPAVDCSAP